VEILKHIFLQAQELLVLLLVEVHVGLTQLNILSLLAVVGQQGPQDQEAEAEVVIEPTIQVPLQYQQVLFQLQLVEVVVVPLVQIQFFHVSLLQEVVEVVVLLELKEVRAVEQGEHSFQLNQGLLLIVEVQVIHLQ